MGEGDRGSFLDSLVDLLARALDSAGLNGTRLRWRWNQRKREMGETGLRALILWRSARGRHKMCPSCRALVPRSAWRCSECGASLARVRGPGLGRLVSNVLPGATATTSILLLVNGLCFLLVLMRSPEGGGADFGRLLRFDLVSLVRFGAGSGYLVREHGELWRLVTPIFLHGGLLHFFFNSYVLLQVGPLVEQEYGTERFTVIYLASGILGNVASQALRDGITVGASGAILGLIGLLLVYGARRGGVFGKTLRAAMTEYAVYILIFSLLPGIDLLAHVGGFLGGALMGWVVPLGPFASRRTAALWEGLALGAVLLVLASFYQVARHGEEGAQALLHHFHGP